MHELPLLHFSEQTGRYENEEIAVDGDALERVRLDRYRSLLAREDCDMRSEYYAADAYARNPERWHVGMVGVHALQN